MAVTGGASEEQPATTLAPVVEGEPDPAERLEQGRPLASTAWSSVLHSAAGRLRRQIGGGGAAEQPPPVVTAEEEEPDPERGGGLGCVRLSESRVTGFLKAYNLVFRIRLLAYSVMCMAYLVTLCVGGFVQELVRPYMLQRWEWWTAFVSFYLFPLFFSILALCVDGANDLFLDALSNPCLYHLRKVFRSLAIGVPLAYQDMAIIGVFEGIPIFSGFVIEPIAGRETLSRGPIVPIAVYARGGLIATFIFVALSLAARILLKFGYCEKYRSCEFPIHQIGTAWRNDYFGSIRNVDATMPVTSVASDQASSLLKFDAVEDIRDLTEISIKDMRTSLVFSQLLMILVAIIFEISIRSKIGWALDEDEEIDDGFLMSGMLIVVLVLIASYIFQRRCLTKSGSVAGCGYLTCLVFVGVFTLLGLYLRATNFEGADPMVGVFSPPAAGSIAVGGSRPPPASSYPICLNRWAHDDATANEDMLTILDLALLADVVYRGDRDQIVLGLENVTNGTALEGMRLVDHVPNELAGAWSVFEAPQLKMRVVAVRGTQRSSDVLFNLNLYAKIVVMQAFKFVVPMFEVLPLWSVRSVVADFSLPEAFGSPNVWTPLLEATRTWRDKGDNYSIVLTGHSLGGALSAIVGSHLRVPAIAFSAPGEFYSLDKFDLTEEEVVHSVVNVIPMHDVVPQLDYQAGMLQQHIECSATGLGALLNCHTIRRTICELYRGCGDLRGRTYFDHPGKFLPSEKCGQAK